jgi:hypothetical protein
VDFTLRILHVKHPVLTFGPLALSRLTVVVRLSLELLGDSDFRLVVFGGAGARRNGRIWTFAAPMFWTWMSGYVERTS